MINFNFNKMKDFLFKRFLACIAVISILILYSSDSYGLFMTVSAKRLTGTVNDEYRKYLEEKYGYAIIIDDSVKEKNAIYTSIAVSSDVELKILKDIETAFSMIPDGFVNEINDFFKSSNFSPSIIVRKKNDSDNIESAGWFNFADASIYIVTDGNDFIRILLHEFAHEISYVLSSKNKIGDLEKYFTQQNNNSNVPYNINYNRLYKTVISDEYKNAYLSVYSSKNFNEDFAETFAHAVMQPRYISSYGGGVKKPIHNKIEIISKALTETFNSVKDAKFLLKCLPDPPAAWAVESVKKAKEKGIIPWNIYGLNNAELTRYDAALILQPFLYKYIEESTLLKRGNLIKDPVIPENFIYDILDGEDIALLHNLRIMTVSNGRFNPEWKIQRQSAAIILTKTAQLFGINDTPNKNLTCGDAAYIADWARAYVKFVMSLNIMNSDANNNFNPEKYITYQEFYASLLNLSNLKEEYNRKNNIMLPSTSYSKIIGKGASLSSDGWIYYYNYAFDYTFNFNSYTGKGRQIINDSVYEGDFVNGLWHGKGKITWKNDGSWYEGDWVKNERTGKGKYVWSDGTIYEGEWKSGVKHGNGKIRLANGLWYDGEWADDNFWNGRGNYVFENGDKFEGEWKNGAYWNGNGRLNINGAWYDVHIANGAVVYHQKAS